ncbi:MAG: Gfo/Idh/MocA family oxidoreductase [Planctomycetia bacterium]|nr:Gfo/Idh/MocA family oxidoreductase [Planctomycetia bacterium]
MSLSRRQFLASAAASASAAAVMSQVVQISSVNAQSVPNIAGFGDTLTKIDETRPWEKYTDRKIRVGLVGYGLCKFSTQFGLQNHPNVEIVAVSDLIPERCQALARDARCAKTYPSLEEMLKDDSIEAIYLATDAPSHSQQAIATLKRGKHVAVAVPAIFWTLDDAQELYDTVKNSGLVYTMFETTAYRDSCYQMRQLYKAGAFGRMIYTEGEYYHFNLESLDSFRKWRDGMPPMLYPTHSNGFYCCVTGGSFTEVSCMGMPSIQARFQPENNVYKNPFGTEVALFRTSEGGMARMAVSWDTPHYEGEKGRCRGDYGTHENVWQAVGLGSERSKNLNLLKPALPPGVEPGGHGGSHGYLGHDFVDSILRNRKPLVDVKMALDLTVAGIVAHQSAMKDGELMKIPQFEAF